jgi:hypothetical protein
MIHILIRKGSRRDLCIIWGLRFLSWYELLVMNQNTFIDVDLVNGPELQNWGVISCKINNYGVSPFCTCSNIICLCISPKLSNCRPHELHLYCLERSSLCCWPVSDEFNWPRFTSLFLRYRSSHYYCYNKM